MTNDGGSRNDKAVPRPAVGNSAFRPLVPKVRLWARKLGLATALRGGQAADVMRSRYQIREPECAHFVTSTIMAWLPAAQSCPPNRDRLTHFGNEGKTNSTN